MKINQLDLFSGIGGFHLGFERAGYEVTSYFSEIDQHAIAVYKHQFPTSTYVGSVTNVRGADLPRIDLITFGSPCQDFSLAGKRLGMEGERSSLILQAIRLISECRPSVFVWENVKGTFSSNDGADFWAIIQAFANIGGYRLEWQLLNTSWFLPQNRERIYLVGYSTTTGGDWRGVFPIASNNREANDGSSQAEVVDKRGTLKNGRNASTLCSGYYKMPSDGDYLKVKSATSQGYEEATIGDSINLSQPNSETRRGRVGKQKAQTLETSCNQAVVEPIIGAIRGRNPENPNDNTKGIEFKQRLELNKKGESNCLTSDVTMNMVIEPNYKYEAANELVRRNTLIEGEVKGLDFYNQSVRDVIPTLTDPKHNSQGLFDGYRIRRLTPIECERLQGFPDNHTAFGNYDGVVKPMSNTQRYKQCGNAVTVDVVSEVAKNCLPLFKTNQQ
jgi:DNA (cytosine-5)-methyltransferase 1